MSREKYKSVNAEAGLTITGACMNHLSDHARAASGLVQLLVKRLRNGETLTVGEIQDLTKMILIVSDTCTEELREVFLILGSIRADYGCGPTDEDDDPGGTHSPPAGKPDAGTSDR